MNIFQDRIIMMQVFDINKSKMDEEQGGNLYDQTANKLDTYLFACPDRRTLNLHESHINDTALLAIRIVGFVYLTGIYLLTLLSEHSLLTNIIYLTMVGYFGTWLYFGLALQDYLLNERPRSPLVPGYVEDELDQISFCAEFPITIIFWSLLLKILLDDPKITTGDIVIQSNLHAAPLFFLLLDTVFNSFSFHIRHISVLSVFVVIYIIILMAYSLAVKPIYGPINFTDFQSYLISIGCLLLALLIHFLARFIFRNCKLNRLKQKDELAQSLLGNNRRLSQIQDTSGQSGKQSTAFRQSVDL